jgi:Zn-dependent peptidase ImmA (M78 family)
MDEMTTAYINRDMLRWAITRADTSPTELAEAMKRSRDDIRAWMDGESKPTFRQAQELARRLRVPFGFLFLDGPPDDDLPIPDFRRVRGAVLAPEPSVDLRDVIADVMRKQEWFAEYQRDRLDEPLPFAGSFTVDDAPTVVAADMVECLDFDERARRESQREGFLREFSRSAQEIGILVMRSGIVGTNTRRALDVEEFRGFAIADPYAPAVFVNGNDAPAAQIFTLAHELAHIWIGATGVSDAGPAWEPDNDVEVEEFCNRVAGDLLVPWDRVETMLPQGSVELKAWIDELARKFHVSTVMVARQLWEHEAIDRDAFFEFYADESAKWQLDRKSPGPSGGNFYLTAGVRNSRLLSEAVIESMRASKTTVRDASRLLGMKPKNLGRFLDTIGAE